jgi:serine/threonine protein kinase/WD40 repeat protein
MPELNVPSGGAETPAATPPVIPGYSLLRCIGRGSYGEVWLAQNAAGEYLAVKIVFRKTFERERPFEREFSGIQKFEPVSRASPSQVSILQVGRNDEAGFFYYVMELADDQRADGGPDTSESLPGSQSSPLQRQIDPATYKPKTLRGEVAAHGRLPYDRALDISLSLARALQHLHAHSLIHRDIKPSNIIFVDGVPKLADIGLVTDVGASISYVGTEGFLPPEGPVSKQADIYSLGKVLYEMSTGQDRMEFPELPTFLGESDEKQGLLELNLVFLKACQNDPHKRYRTAQEMYADLAILRSGKSLKSARAAERRLKKITRVSLAVACIAILVGVGLYASDQYRIRKLRDKVSQQHRLHAAAENATRDKSLQLIESYLRSADELGGIDALPWYARALHAELDPDRAEAHRRLLADKLKNLPRLVGFLVHGAEINSARFSPDATRVITGGADGIVRIQHVATGTAVSKPLTHPRPVLHAELSPDNERAVTLCDDGTAWLWRVALDETHAREIEHGAPVLGVGFSPSGRFVLTRGGDTRAVIWDGLSARVRFAFDCGETTIDARYTPNGQHVCVLTTNTVSAWETERGQRVALARSSIGPLTGMILYPDSRRVLAHSGASARSWNLTSGDWSEFSIQEVAPIALLAFRPDGREVITGTEAGAFHSWDTLHARMAADAWHTADKARELELSPDGAAALVRTKGRASLMDVSAARPLATLPACDARQATAFSSDARLFLVAAGGGVARLAEMSETASDFLSLNRDQLLAMARVLSGGEIDTNDSFIAVSAERLAVDWAGLREHTALRPAHRPDWHAARAERFEKTKSWFALQFHANALKKLNPADPRADAWTETAARELVSAELLTTRSGPITDHFPDRSPAATPNLIDLSPFYNASLTQTWLPIKDIGRSNDLAQLPSGLQKFAGVQFDVRGLIQLSGSALENLGGQFPKQVVDIPANRKATSIHFLQGAAWDALYGTVIGRYRVNYVNGKSREVKIIFGRTVRDWWFPPTQPQLTMGAAVAWQGSNPASRQLGRAVRIYKFTWINPLPDVEIKSIDFESAMEKPAPFLLAITLEPTD